MFDLGEYHNKFQKLNSGKNYKACVITFGCQQNEADSEKARGILSYLGYTIVDEYKHADLILVNTCAIRQHAEEKALSMIGNFRQMKKANPELVIGVIGCMSSEAHVVDHVKNKMPYVTFTLEPNMLYRLPEVILRARTENKRSFIIGEDDGGIREGLPIKRDYPHKAWVSIMYGCNNFCSYCIVPYTRGRERSRASSEVISEVKQLVDSGYKEITLLGQNVNSYRSELDFAGLLSALANIEGDFIIRFMTSHPKDVSPRLIEVMKEYSGKVAPYFHLPLQSGSNKILKSMHRTYTRERFLEVVDELRLAVPDICLSTDVIVGFPGETDADFKDTIDILSRVEFDMVYAFRYSKREGTPAAKMPDQVDPTVVSARMDELLKMQDKISLAKALPYENGVYRVLVDGIDDSDNGRMVARTGSNKLVHFDPTDARIGDFVNVKITKASAFLLIGKQI